MIAPFLALGFVAFGALALANFRAALVLFCGLLPSYLLRFSLGPIPSTALEGFFLILAVIWIVRHNGLRFSLRTLGKLRAPLLLGLAAACFAASYAPDVFAAIGVLKAFYFEPVVLILVLISTLRTRQDWLHAGTALVVSGTAVAVLGITQYITTLGIPAPWDVERRITSVYDFPNAVGLFLAPIVAALVAYFATNFHSLSGKVKVLMIGAGLLMSAAIVLAKTEAAFVAIPAALLLVLLVSQAKVRTKTVVTYVAIAAFILCFTIVPVVRQKILLDDISGTARTTVWGETSQLLRDHVFLGAGLSGFPTAIAPYHDATYFEIFQYPHNIILNIWVELGLLGVVAFFFVTIQAIRIIFRHRDNPLVLATAAALFTMCIHGLVDVPFFKNDLAMLTAILLAVLVAAESGNLSNHKK